MTAEEMPEGHPILREGGDKTRRCPHTLPLSNTETTVCRAPRTFCGTSRWTKAPRTQRLKGHFLPGVPTIERGMAWQS